MDWSKGGITYSLVYNTSYMIPTIILSLIVIAFLMKPLYTLFSMPLLQSLKPRSMEDDKEEVDTLPSYRILSYIFASIFALADILSMIPQLKMNYLGYFVMPLALASLVYEIYRVIKMKKEKQQIQVADILMIVVFVLLLALSIVGVVSRYTYGASFYPVEGE